MNETVLKEINQRRRKNRFSMELAIPISITMDTLADGIQNDFQETSPFYLPRCLIPIGNLFLSITFISVFVLLPMVEIVIGVLFINDCSMNAYIPIYLVFAGFNSLICLIFFIIGVIQQIFRKKKRMKTIEFIFLVDFCFAIN